MVLDDAIDDRQPKARASAQGLARVEGLKHSTASLLAEPHAGIFDLHVHGLRPSAIGFAPCTQTEAAALGHRVLGVHTQVQ